MRSRLCLNRDLRTRAWLLGAEYGSAARSFWQAVMVEAETEMLGYSEAAFDSMAGPRPRRVRALLSSISRMFQ